MPKKEYPQPVIVRPCNPDLVLRTLARLLAESEGMELVDDDEKQPM